MTTPEPHGYPDWGRFIAQGDKLYIGESVVGGGISATRGPHFVGDVPALYMRFVNATNPVKIEMQFQDTDPPSIFHPGHTFELPAPGEVQIVVPVMGPWVLITLTFSAGAVTWSLTLASASAKGTGLGGNITDNILFSQVGTAVGAGATVTIDTSFIRPGPALLNIDTSLATWLATLSARSYLAVLTRLDTITHLHSLEPRHEYLTPSQIRFTFQNTTGAPGAFTAALTSRPFFPGA